jgi:predicted nucleic acid-binding protein
MIVISDCSPLSVLVCLNQIDILPTLFGRVVVPPAVVSELAHPRSPQVLRDWTASPPSWLTIQSPNSTDPSLGSIGLGELEAISLAVELKADLLLVDDRKARHVALSRGIHVTGTLGLLELAAIRGLLDLPTVIAELRKTDFRIADELIDEAVKRDAARKSKST